MLNEQHIYYQRAVTRTRQLNNSAEFVENTAV